MRSRCARQGAAFAHDGAAKPPAVRSGQFEGSLSATGIVFQQLFQPVVAITRPKTRPWLRASNWRSGLFRRFRDGSGAVSLTPRPGVLRLSACNRTAVPRGDSGVISKSGCPDRPPGPCSGSRRSALAASGHVGGRRVSPLRWARVRAGGIVTAGPEAGLNTADGASLQRRPNARAWRGSHVANAGGLPGSRTSIDRDFDAIQPAAVFKTASARSHSHALALGHGIGRLSLKLATVM